MHDVPEHAPDRKPSDLIVSPGRSRDLLAGPEADDYGPALSVAGPAARTSPVTLLARRKWLIFFVFAVLAAATIPFIWLFFAPNYRATAVVRISPVIEPFVFKSEKSGVLPFYQSFVNTEVSVIYSPTVLQRVLDRPEIRQTDWYKELSREKRPSSSVLVEALQEKLVVSPRMGTELIDIAISMSSARDAKVIVDLVVQEYENLKEELEKQSDVKLAEDLRAEQANLQMQIDGLIKTRFNIAERLGTDKPEELRSQLTQQLSTLESDLHRHERELELTEWQLKLAERAETMPADGPDRRYANDSRWQELYFDLERDRSELAFAQQQGGELNPRVRRAKANVELADRLLQERQTQLDESWQRNPAESAEMAVSHPRRVLEQGRDQLRKQIELLKKDVEAKTLEVKQAGEIAQEIASYDEQIKQKRELYEAVRNRRDVLQMEKQAPARVKVVAYATEPSAPDNDRRLLLSALALIGALGGGVTVGYLRSLVDKRIYDVSELRHMYQVPFLGMLPKLSSTHLPRELGGTMGLNGPVDAVGNPRLALMENMRMVRTTLLERVAQTGERVVLITSSLPNTGKSSVAVLLAQSLAVVGKKVLLVEADLRRPVLGQRLGIASGRGLATLLTGQAVSGDVVARPQGTRFDLIPAGDVPDTFDPELLANGVFSSCMSQWRQQYDFVLLDSPPLLRVADAQILAGSVDGTIMVLRSSHDRRTETMDAISQLAAVGGTLLGTVLIGSESGAGDYGSYGRYYEYGRALAAAAPSSNGEH